MRRFLYGLALVVACMAGIHGWRWKSRFVDASKVDEDGTEKPLYGKNSGIVVSVGGGKISYEDVDWGFRYQLMGLGDREELSPIPDDSEEFEKSAIQIKNRVLSDFIERKLLFEYLKKDEAYDLSRPELYTSCLNEWQNALKNLPPKEHVADSVKDQERLKERICEWHLIQAYLEEKIYSKISITDNDLRRYYAANKENFSKPEMVQLRQIVLPSEEETNRIKRILKPNNFIELALKHSITPEAVDGGLLKPFAKGDMPRFFNVAFSMRIGDIREDLKTPYGFHIIRLEKKFPAKQLSFEEAKSEILEELKKKYREKEYQKWLELASNAVPVSSPEKLW